ncbi:universal stress protein [Nocardioides albus]|uniref:Nucleotide-binding universal stress UspA family protein n=1 Tax=Nocardioides albus TaxID=1841 RepID=A0A7W5A5S4_9ACTN|nr:universal stress protein [Nocardioides albus]MBB3089970.1 nucleotide-binding universal stress UspA family protein [Nocardioides albus]GGU36936.1 universal stress protein [Nocardioides albus]
MTIVVAYADTPPGHAAVTAAVAESREEETVVLVAAVRDEQVPEIDEIAARWPDLAGRVVIEHGDLGDPSDTVIQVAQRLDSRLIVVGLRARTPVGKLVFGSTAQRILLDATCPVLAVKPSAVDRAVPS